MKRTSTGFKIHRTLVIGLVFFVVIAALLALAASAKRSRSLVPRSLSGVVNPPRQTPYPRAPAARSLSLLVRRLL